MTWLNPLAFLGLVAVAIPVIAHLFGRPRARRVLFPSLRFLEATREAPIRWSRPSDLLLLVVRCLIVGVAVVALARPHWPGAGGTTTARVARVVIVDTSRSMSRLTTTGDTAAVLARQMAERLVGEADAGLVVHSNRPGAEFPGAAAWLATRPEAREILVVSDFQAVAVDSAQVAQVPTSIAVRFMRVDRRRGSDSLAAGSDAPGPARADVVLRGDSTYIRWISARGSFGDSAIVLLSSDTERSAATSAFDAARQAVRLPGALPEDRSARIVTPGFPGRTALLSASHAPGASWQGNALVRLAGDPLLQGTGAVPAIDDGGAGLTPVVDPATGSVLAWAGSTGSRGSEQLVLFATIEPGSAAMAALVAATARSLADPAPVAEDDPVTLPDESLRAWERPVADRAAVDEAAHPGRWLWLVVLGLLGLEAWLRRSRSRLSHTAAPGTEARRAA